MLLNFVAFLLLVSLPSSLSLFPLSENGSSWQGCCCCCSCCFSPSNVLPSVRTACKYSNLPVSLRTTYRCCPGRVQTRKASWWSKACYWLTFALFSQLFLTRRSTSFRTFREELEAAMVHFEAWQAILLQAETVQFSESQRLCPTVCELLSNIPLVQSDRPCGIISLRHCMINKLEESAVQGKQFCFELVGIRVCVCVCERDQLGIYLMAFPIVISFRVYSTIH